MTDTIDTCNPYRWIWAYIDLAEKIVKVSAMLGKFIKMLKSGKLGKGEENRKGE